MVVTAAVPADHPELARRGRLGIPVVPRKEALAALCAGRETVAVTRHARQDDHHRHDHRGADRRPGSTRPASPAAGSRPGAATPGSAATGSSWSRPTSTTRRSWRSHPTIAVVNNVEADHLECYGSLDALEDGVRRPSRRGRERRSWAPTIPVPRGSRRGSATGCVRFGLGGDADVRIHDVSQRPDRTARRGSRFRDGGEIGAHAPGARAPQPAQRRRRRSARSMRSAATSRPALDGAGAVPRRGPAVRAAGRGGRRRRRGRLRAPPDRAGRHARGGAAGVSRAAARGGVPAAPLLAHRSCTATRWATALAAADLVVVTEVYAAREQPMPGRERRSWWPTRRERPAATAHFEPIAPALGRRGRAHAPAGRRRAHAGRGRHHARGSGAGRPAAAADEAGLVRRWRSLALLGLGLWFVAPRLLPAARLLPSAAGRAGRAPGSSRPAHVVGALKLPRVGQRLRSTRRRSASRVRKLPGIKGGRDQPPAPGDAAWCGSTEAVPVALAPAKDGLAHGGRAGPGRCRSIRSRTAPDLPVTPTPDSVVAGLLGRVQEIDPGCSARSRMRPGRSQGDVVLEVRRPARLAPARRWQRRTFAR